MHLDVSSVENYPQEPVPFLLKLMDFLGKKINGFLAAV